MAKKSLGKAISGELSDFKKNLKQRPADKRAKSVAESNRAHLLAVGKAAEAKRKAAPKAEHLEAARQAVKEDTDDVRLVRDEIVRRLPERGSNSSDGEWEADHEQTK